jgi:hypothetical protein
VVRRNDGADLFARKVPTIGAALSLLSAGVIFSCIGKSTNGP